MRVKAIRLKRARKVSGLLRTFRYLADARHDYPMIAPSEYLARGGVPVQEWWVKLLCIVLHPKREEWPGSAWDLAAEAARVLEERHGVVLDWAAGFRESGAVWLFLKPVASDAATLQMRRFRVTPEDLAALREALAGRQEEAKESAGEGRWRQCGRRSR